MPRVLLPPQCSVGGCLEMARSREVVGVKFWQKVFWARVFATHQVEKTLFPLCAGPPNIGIAWLHSATMNTKSSASCPTF